MEGFFNSLFLFSIRLIFAVLVLEYLPLTPHRGSNSAGVSWVIFRVTYLVTSLAGLQGDYHIPRTPPICAYLCPTHSLVLVFPAYPFYRVVVVVMIKH